MDITTTEFKPVTPTTNCSRTSKTAELHKLLKYTLRFDPLEELLALYPKLKESDKKQVCLDLMRFLYPQIKAVELDQHMGEKVNVNIIFPEDKKTPTVETNIEKVEASN
ncbi:MAG: hypothetical protein AMQ22_00938 [Candidatus Methanofastidiosum methylothiophilum]|jgi:hypothetical protein|uniref:Uncharacterized protein n=1 Tax=Candidatus Methanofastidiosum methylothiophilum TaxID=1705564 RepID=A0A150J4S8_9EURY|nr:MAG: hypothetical protein AMQ22_00938 [Candidatus Methanofastidiosum methylthiophilus]